MAFINFENLPSENTPLTGGEGGNLNVMQEIVNISNEVDEDYRVNLLKGKNLFNDIFETGTVDGNGINTSSTTRLRNKGFIKVKPNTTYSLSYTTSSNLKVSISYYANNSYSTNRLSYDAFTTDNPLTFTTPNNCNYIRIIVGLTNDGAISSTNIISNVMLNEGSTALPYEAFIQNQIVVDNDKYTDTLNVGQFDSRSRVNVLKSKNLLDLQFLQLITNSSGTVISNNNYWDVIVDTRNINSLYVSGNFSLLADNTIRVGTYSSYPVLGSTGTRLTLQANGKINTSNVNYVLFAFGLSSSSVTIDQVKASFMINEGSTALPYEPYITPSIYVDNEEIYQQPSAVIKSLYLGNITTSNTGFYSVGLTCLNSAVIGWKHNSIQNQTKIELYSDMNGSIYIRASVAGNYSAIAINNLTIFYI